MSAPTKSIRFDAIVCMRAGDPATAYATAAVRPRPTNIHPYTARRYAVTRSATASAVTGETRVAGKSSMIVSCACPTRSRLSSASLAPRVLTNLYLKYNLLNDIYFVKRAFPIAMPKVDHHDSSNRQNNRVGEETTAGHDRVPRI